MMKRIKMCKFRITIHPDVDVTGLQHVLYEVESAETSSLRTEDRATKLKALTSQGSTVELAGELLVLTEEVANLAATNTYVASGNVAVRADVLVELAHEGLAETHDLSVALAARREVGTTLAATHRERGAFSFAGRDKKEKWWDVSPLFTIGNMLFLEDQPTDGGCGFSRLSTIRSWPISFYDAAPHVAFPAGGMEAMDGPINFGPRTPGGGLLVSGYEFQPLYENAYNPPYYKELFENYGFQNYFNQHTYLRRLEVGQLSDSVYERVKRLEESPGYCFKHISKKNLEQVAEDFRLVYNKAWALFFGCEGDGPRTGVPHYEYVAPDYRRTVGLFRLL